jgi:2-keto-4-pentenoate hydratase/2-oxohepta-3-ene-1,7-dioic acid hydratase in catechol pathway
MRIVSFDNGGQAAVGVRLGDEVVDLGIADPGLPSDIKGLVAGGAEAFAAADKAAQAAGADARRPLESLNYLPPIANSGKYICLGRNYAAHAAEGGADTPTYPVVFYRGASSLVGHLKPIIRPKCSEQLDFEAEMVCVIGKPARHVMRADAHDYVAGYSVFNDGTIREYQRRTSQWTIGKNFDGTGGFGPEFVTADELEPGATGLRIQTRLNGEVMQDANTSDMVFDVAETIELLSECMTLEAGDVIVTGTPSGVGYARTPPVWMKAGDICEIEVENIGVLRNPIADEV